MLFKSEFGLNYFSLLDLDLLNASLMGLSIKNNNINYSITNGNNIKNQMSDKDFYDWFVGFCDAEASFAVNPRKDKPSVINFSFRIELHIKDIQVLYFIKEKLGCGTVVTSNNRNSARRRGMNSGRSFSNENSSEVGSPSNKDILSLPPLLEFGPNGGIRVISNKQWVTAAKFFMLTPYSKDNELLKPLYLQSKAELCAFFGLSDVTIYKYINSGNMSISRSGFYN